MRNRSARQVAPHRSSGQTREESKKSTMDEASILDKFDKLVQSGLVLYDDKQEIVEKVDEGLKVSQTATRLFEFLPQVSLFFHACQAITDTSPDTSKFHFILTSALAKKPTFHSPRPVDVKPKLQQPDREGSDINTIGFEISNVGSSHFLAANKFCFARPHLMLLTVDGNQRQYKALNEQDFTAAWMTLSAIGLQDYAVFYNCGQDGGCSRLHKHMQLMPMPRHSFASFLDRADGKEPPSVPFVWFYHRFEDGPLTTASSLFAIYIDLLKRADEVGRGRGEHAVSMPPGAACPHNVIFTKRWMVVLPRRRAGVNKEAGANAMGMLGYIAVATEKEIEAWERLGLRQTLAQLGVAKEDIA